MNLLVPDLLVPSYKSHCEHCEKPMPRAARLVLLGRILGWSYYEYSWWCPEHAPGKHPEIKQTVDEKMRGIRAGMSVYGMGAESEAPLGQQDRRPPERRMPPEPETIESVPQTTSAEGAFNLVLVAAESTAFPFAEQLEQKLLREVAAKPRFPLTPGVRITTLRIPELPAETRAGLEAFIWDLQGRYEKKGGRWQGEFYPTPVGVTFLVVYLE